jgi:hypothetical protein
LFVVRNRGGDKDDSGNDEHRQPNPYFLHWLCFTLPYIFLSLSSISIAFTAEAMKLKKRYVKHPTSFVHK